MCCRRRFVYRRRHRLVSCAVLARSPGVRYKLQTRMRPEICARAAKVCTHSRNYARLFGYCGCCCCADCRQRVASPRARQIVAVNRKILAHSIRYPIHATIFNGAPVCRMCHASSTTRCARQSAAPPRIACGFTTCLARVGCIWNITAFVHLARIFAHLHEDVHMLCIFPERFFSTGRWL